MLFLRGVVSVWISTKSCGLPDTRLEVIRSSFERMTAFCHLDWLRGDSPMPFQNQDLESTSEYLFGSARLLSDKRTFLLRNRFQSARARARQIHGAPETLARRWFGVPSPKGPDPWCSEALRVS